MPVSQKSEIPPSRDNPSLIGIGVHTVDVDEEEKYWKLKIIYSALESVVFNRNPNPKLPLDVLNRLRKILHDGDVQESSVDPVLTQETKSILVALMVREIENVSDTLVQTQMELLKNSTLNENQDWLSKLKESQNPLEEVVKIAQRRRQVEIELVKKVDEAKSTRLDELNRMEDKLSQVKQLLKKAMQTVGKQKQPEEIKRKYDALKIRSDFLALKTDIAKREQLHLENPPEVTTATQEALDELSQVNERLKNENDTLSAFFSQHDALPSHMQAMLAELQETDECIKRQEWILKSLKGYQENTLPEEDFMHESFF